MSEKLPQGTKCVVCDDVATGKHYGVASCNGCKTFFRRALVNNREFVCQGGGNCAVNKGVRCACRFCRLQKCYAVGMDKNSIQNDRDRIGYTKRKRKTEGDVEGSSHTDADLYRDSKSPVNGEDTSPGGSSDLKDVKIDMNALDPIAERLTTLENNFTLLLSRGSDLKSYDTLEDALNAPSRFMQPINCEWSDPVVLSIRNDDKMPFWRQRLITLYIDWAKTFSAFRQLPYTDKVAMVTNHASAFMIMCEAFRTPEHTKSEIAKKRLDIQSIVNSSGSGSSRVPSATSITSNTAEEQTDDANNLDPSIQQSINAGILFGGVKPPNTCQPSTSGTASIPFSDASYIPFALRQIKIEPSDSPEPRLEMIRLPNEYGSLPDDYTTWIPKNYGNPSAGHEGKSDMHNFFDAREYCEGRPTSCSYSEKSTGTTTLVVPRSQSKTLPTTSLSGVTPVLAMMIDLVMKPFRQLNVSTTEFALMQAIMFFDPDTEGLDSASQRNVIAEQRKFVAVLNRHLLKAYNPGDANERYSSIILRIPSIRRAAAKKNESLQVLDMLKMHEMNALVKETSLGPRPSTVQQKMGIGGGAGGVLTFSNDHLNLDVNQGFIA